MKELPQGWAWATLGEVTETLIESNGPQTDHFTYIDITSIDIGSKRVTEPKQLAQAEAPGRARQNVRTSDVLVSLTRPNRNAVAIIGEEHNGAVASTAFQVLRASETVEPKLLYYLIQTKHFIEAMAGRVQGALYPAIRPSDVIQYRFPLPPRSEQSRIVAEIEKELSRLSTAAMQLSSTRVKCRAFLLTVIRRATSQKSHWPTAHASDVCEFITKGTTPAAHELLASGDIPYLKVNNLGFGGPLDFTKSRTFVRKHLHDHDLSRSKVLPGDVLMNIVGPPLGKVAVVPDAYPEYNINQAIARFRTKPGLDPHYLSLLLRNPDVLRWALSRAKTTAGQVNLTLELCRDLPLPIAPEPEQQQIVAAVESAATAADNASAAIETALIRSAQLRQSLLKAAFEGKLVPQDPNDEPASVLLERIRAARTRPHSRARAIR